MDTTPTPHNHTAQHNPLRPDLTTRAGRMLAAGREWINDHLRTPEAEAPMMYGSATVVEHRFIEGIVTGMVNDGLVVA